MRYSMDSKETPQVIFRQVTQLSRGSMLPRALHGRRVRVKLLGQCTWANSCHGIGSLYNLPRISNNLWGITLKLWPTWGINFLVLSFSLGPARQPCPAKRGVHLILWGSWVQSAVQWLCACLTHGDQERGTFGSRPLKQSGVWGISVFIRKEWSTYGEF